MRKIIALLLAVFVLSPNPSRGGVPEKKVLNIYTWVGSIDPRLIRQFERETKILVNARFFDSDEMGELVLISGDKSFDVVEISWVPYFGRQVAMGGASLLELDKSKIPNWENLDPEITKIVSVIDEGNTYGYPHTWGTVGFGYDEAAIKKLFPEGIDFSDINTIFNEDVAEKLSSCGFTLLDHPQDMMDLVMVFIGASPDDLTPENLEKVYKAMMKIRKHLTRFVSNTDRVIADLVNGDICFAQGYGPDILRAQREANKQKNGPKIKYVTPKQWPGFWVDMLVIPRNAPHPSNAHKFLNFLMRPDVAVQNTIYSRAATANKKGRMRLPKDIKNDPILYPSGKIFDNIPLYKSFDRKTERLVTRTWTRIKAG